MREIIADAELRRDMASLLRHALEKNHKLDPCQCSPCEKIAELGGDRSMTNSGSRERAERKERTMTEEVFKPQVVTVQREDRSPLNPKQWCLSLSCGHKVWVTAGRKPQRMKAECDKCPKVRAR